MKVLILEKTSSMGLPTIMVTRIKIKINMTDGQKTGL
jgi:hypothetical protein